jgi:glycosyltransferase involved in cell wall biosynthesis
MPGEEDFGIVMAEALASGKPVVALGRGGACEIVPTDQPAGGVLYDEPGEDALEQALKALEPRLHGIDAAALRAWSMQFSEAEFSRRIRPILTGEGPSASQVDEYTRGHSANQ